MFKNKKITDNEDEILEFKGSEYFRGNDDEIIEKPGTVEGYYQNPFAPDGLRVRDGGPCLRGKY